MWQLLLHRSRSDVRYLFESCDNLSYTQISSHPVRLDREQPVRMFAVLAAAITRRYSRICRRRLMQFGRWSMFMRREDRCNPTCRNACLYVARCSAMRMLQCMFMSRERQCNRCCNACFVCRMFMHGMSTMGPTRCYA